MARLVVWFCFLGVIAMCCGSELPKDDVDAREFATPTTSAADLIKRVYYECLQKGSISCVKPKVLAFLSTAMKKEHIQITEDLTIDRIEGSRAADIEWNSATPLSVEEILEQIDDFLASHQLNLRMPKELVNGEMLALVPKFLLQNIPSEMTVPLSQGRSDEKERSFVKKIAIPFLFGLKFNATALIPLALALIALKTWKALTLGLLSVVLSGAILLFKYTKPKVHYEIAHYAHHPHHLPIEHAQPWEHQHQPYAPHVRADHVQDIAYNAYKQ